MKCNRCGSYAINPKEHGREPGKDLDLCDVCYWRDRAGIGLLEFDLLAIQTFLKINRAEFEKHCGILDISKKDSNRIIEGLI